MKFVYWAAYWYGSPKQSVICEVDANAGGKIVAVVSVFGHSEKEHVTASHIVQYHNDRTSNCHEC